MSTAHRRLGIYEIGPLIGAGGMGEVYRARDTKLQRDVAIKVLPRAFTADHERIARFRREARALAALNHPHVGAIYGFEEVDDTSFLVLELVDGPTLADRIAKGNLTLPEVLSISRQLAEALDAAHEAGIIHRDLKPANVKVTSGGQVKVLDFGIAKVEPAVASGDTETLLRSTVGTEDGVIIGTPAYMSPEQARGLPVDKRTDIWSFGCVVYEMLARKEAFPGKTISDRLAAIIEREPDWTALPAQTPDSLTRLLRRCLQKDTTKRLRDIGDVRLDLEDAPARGHEMKPHQTGRARSWLPLAAASSIAAVIGAGITMGLRQSGGVENESATPRIDEAVVTTLTNYDGTETAGAIAPDGRSFAFVADIGGTTDIWLRQISGGEPVRLTNDPAIESGLVFAPDSENIYFARADGAERSVWRIGALGGQARKVLSEAIAPSVSYDGSRLAAFSPGRVGLTLHVSRVDGSERRVAVRNLQSMNNPARAAWSPDGRQLAFSSAGLFAPRNLFIVTIDDDSVRQVTQFTRSGEGTTAQAWLPDGRNIIVAYISSPRVLGEQDIGIVDVTTGGVTRLTTNVRSSFLSPSLSSDGSRMIVTSNEYRREVWKVPFGPDPDANGRNAIRVVDASLDPMWTNVSRDGRTLLYNNAVVGSRNLWTMPIDRSAPPKQVTSVPGDAVMHSSLSASTTHVAFASNVTGNSDIWVQHVDGSGLRQLTNDAAADSWPVWSPDGQTIMYASLRDGQWETRQVPVQSGPSEKVLDGFFRGDWIQRPDGAGTLVATSDGVGEIRLVDRERGTVLWRHSPPGVALLPVFSPDARLISVPVPESRQHGAIWVYDVATGKPHTAVRFPEPFSMSFRANWTEDGRAFIVNRFQLISHIVMFDRFSRAGSANAR